MSAIATSKTSFFTSLHDLIQYPDKGILSKIIVKDNHCQHTLFCLGANTSIDEHTSTRNATVVAIAGSGTLTLEGKPIELKPGVFIFMPANAPHALEAKEPLAFLLTLSEHG